MDSVICFFYQLSFSLSTLFEVLFYFSCSLCLSNWQSAENKNDAIATGIAPFMQTAIFFFTINTLHGRHIELR